MRVLLKTVDPFFVSMKFIFVKMMRLDFQGMVNKM